MPQFILDTQGEVAAPSSAKIWPYPLNWTQLDSFTQGYVEALFFTDSAPGVTTEEWQAADEHDEGCIPGDVGFSDLAPEALLKIIWDCIDFQKGAAYQAWTSADEYDADEEQAGRDFHYTRNGHGCGFWDGDYPAPHDDALTALAKTFGEVDSYLGDDGKVYLS